MKTFKPTLAGTLCGSVLMSAISASLAVAAPIDIAGTETLLKQLDSEDYLERNAAQSELGKWVQKANKSQVKELQAFSDLTDSPEVRERIRDVIDKNAYIPVPNTRGFMGIQMNPMNGGVGIAAVERGQAAEKAGLQPGDVIIEMDGKDLTKMNQRPDEALNYLRNYVQKKKKGEKLQLKFKRGGKLMEKDLKLGSREDYEKNNNMQGFQGNQFIIPPGGQNFQLQIAPGANGRLQVLPQRLNAEDRAQIEKDMRKMMEQMKKNGNKLEMKDGELKLEFNFGPKPLPAKPEKPAKPAAPEKKPAEPKK